jgi:hypothetical protein
MHRVKEKTPVELGPKYFGVGLVPAKPKCPSTGNAHIQLLIDEGTKNVT